VKALHFEEHTYWKCGKYKIEFIDNRYWSFENDRVLYNNSPSFSDAESVIVGFMKAEKLLKKIKQGNK
jgi:hypothetical protein